MAIGVFLIVAIIYMKFQPVYTVYFGDEEIGYIKNKNKFETQLKEELYDNQEKNIAFSNVDENVAYKLKFVQKEKDVQEENTLLAIHEKADITYLQYAISVQGTEKYYLKTEEDAKQIQQNLTQQFEDVNIAVNAVYTKKLEVNDNENLQEISTELAKQISEQKEEEQKRKDATIDGIYLAVKPISGTITSRYGSRESIRNHTHKGLDIAAPIGTAIKATADGTVSFSGVKGGYGKLIIIDHGNGIQTYYGHCSKLYVKVGDKVNSADVIGAVGTTGNSTGPHLHFEIRRNGEYVNPAQYLYK